MKTIAVLLLSCLLIASCLKKNNSNAESKKEGQEALFHETLEQETQKPDDSYVFDIDSFMYLEEFPKTIAGIKAMYPDEPFEEKTSKNDLKGFNGSYWYLFSSPNIRFSFLGDTMEGADLCIVVITNKNYQCKNVQVIDMAAEELERVSGKKLTLDKTIAIYSKSDDGLIIKTEDGIVRSYTILGSL